MHEVAQELLKRKQALASLRSFGDYMRDTGELDFKFAPAAHHLLLIDALEALDRGEFDRLMIMMPPGGAKSTYVSIQFVLWHLAKYPDEVLLCASNTETLAENFNRRRRTCCQTEQWQLLSGTRMSRDQMGVGKFSTELGGACQAAGVGTGIVGTRSNINLLDDPVLNFEQSLSPGQMDKQWNWYQADFRSRLVPTGKEIIVTTRWSRRDIPGRILEMIKTGEETGWHVIRLPMEADRADDPLGRPLGARLWPEHFTERQVSDNKRDAQRWQGMYQQIPMDEAGVWVGAENISIVDSLPAKLTLVCGVDIALTVGGGDYTVFAVCGISDDRDLYIVDVVRQQVDVDTTCDTFFRLMDEHDITYFYMDDDNASKMLNRLMVEKCKSRGRSLPIHLMPLAGQDKEIRAAPLRGLFMQKRIKILSNENWNNTLIAELMDFPAVDHDDQIDALSLVGRQYSSIPTPTKDRDKGAPLEFFIKEVDGQQVTSIGLDKLFEENDRHGILNVARRRI